MSARFADGSQRLAGMAAAIAGWRPDEFWRATPSELATVIAALAGDPEASAGQSELQRLQEMFPDG
jgi:hypothetical protein